MTSAIRSFTTRSLCGLLGAAALAVGAPTVAFADHRDDRGGRRERHYDHGRRDHGWDGRQGHFRRAWRPAYGLHRHGPSCSHRPAWRYGYRPVHPYAVFTRSGWYFGR